MVLKGLEPGGDRRRQASGDRRRQAEEAETDGPRGFDVKSGFVWLWFLLWFGLNLYYTCRRCHLDIAKSDQNFRWLRAFATLQETERGRIPRSLQLLGPASRE